MNLFHYLKWRGDLTFDKDPINEVDALIFTELSYIPLDKLVYRDHQKKGYSLSYLATEFFDLYSEDTKLGAILPSSDIFQTFKAAAATPRFKDVEVRGYINLIDKEKQQQFCAMCFDIDEETTFVAFRGTDDTLIGWKENFNMAFFTPIPAQTEAKEYFERVSSHTKRKFYIGGHSKGGNLAIYAGLMANEKQKKKILQIYNFDGPGFRRQFTDSITDEETVNKIHNVLPEGTIIGAIFETVGKCEFVRSFARGLYQHDAFSWSVLGKSFVRVKHVSKGSLEFHDLLDKWVAKMTDEEKMEFVDAFYKICTANELSTLTQIASNKLKFIVNILKAEEKTKKVIYKAFSLLIKEKFLSKDNKKEKTNKKLKDKKLIEHMLASENGKKSSLSENITDEEIILIAEQLSETGKDVTVPEKEEIEAIKITKKDFLTKEKSKKAEKKPKQKAEKTKNKPSKEK